MTTTHALFGALLGASTAPFAPSLTPTAVAVGFVAGALPDVDLVAEHRRSTHFPVSAVLVAAPVVLAAPLVGTPTAILTAVAVAAVAGHCLMDAFAGGLEHRPWLATSEKAVYDHVNGRWIRPRRWVRYAGAPEDLVLAAAFALPALAVTTGHLRTGLLATVAVSGLFVAVRRRLPALAERIWSEAGDA